MRALLLASLLFALNATAQTLPAVPDSQRIQPDLHLQKQKSERPSLGGFIAPVAFGTLLSTFFVMSDSESQNDMAPAALIGGLAFGAAGLAIEISLNKRKRTAPTAWR